jgi:hypothetical protein
MDLTSIVEKKSGKRNQEGKASKKVKSHVDVALGISQKSTASMGVHDRRTPNEGDIKPERVPRVCVCLSDHINYRSLFNRRSSFHVAIL